MANKPPSQSNARRSSHNHGDPNGKPGRENEPPTEVPGEETPAPSDPPDYRDEPPPAEKAGRPRGDMDDGVAYDTKIDHGDDLRLRENLGGNGQKARYLSQDDVEEWQNRGTPARGRSSRAFEEEIRDHEYRDKSHDHPHWYHDTRGRTR